MEKVGHVKFSQTDPNCGKNKLNKFNINQEKLHISQLEAGKGRESINCRLDKS